MPALAERYETPLYIYSQATIQGQVARLQKAALELNTEVEICYALKANGNVEIIKLMGEMGVGADLTSGGELFLAQQAGIPAQQMHFSGVGKTRPEIAQAIDAGISAIHLESEMEFDAIAQLASQKEKIVSIAVRVNPDIAADTHHYIATGNKVNKFGVPWGIAKRMLKQAKAHSWLRPVGLAAHIGSQIRDLAPFAALAKRLIEMANEVEDAGIRLDYLDVGGGVGIGYGADSPPLNQWVGTVGEPIAAAGYKLIVEPGRALVGEAGVLLCQAIYVKRQGGIRFIIVDAGMSELLRPTLYQAHHPIMPVKKSSEALLPANIVGPICESGDFIAKDRALPPIQPGDLLAVMDAGAYGFAMSSNYNGRRKPAEILISGEAARLIRPRQSNLDLLG